MIRPAQHMQLSSDKMANRKSVTIILYAVYIQNLRTEYHIQAFVLTNFSVDYFILYEQLLPEVEVNSEWMHL